MDLATYVDSLGREFATLVEAGSDEARALVERLSGALESAIRLTLLDTLSAAADEITRDLAPGSVELRLRGRDPQFVVTAPQTGGGSGDDQHDASPVSGGATVAPDLGADDAATARINFRLPEQLKTAIEDAAAREGRSVNAWLVRVASSALQPAVPPVRTSVRSTGHGTQHVKGWVR